MSNKIEFKPFKCFDPTSFCTTRIKKELAIVAQCLRRERPINERDEEDIRLTNLRWIRRGLRFLYKNSLIIQFYEFYSIIWFLIIRRQRSEISIIESPIKIRKRTLILLKGSRIIVFFGNYVCFVQNEVFLYHKLPQVALIHSLLQMIYKLR